MWVDIFGSAKIPVLVVFIIENHYPLTIFICMKQGVTKLESHNVI